MFVCVLSGVTSSDMDSVYIQLCRVEEHRLGKSTAAFFPISHFFFFFGGLPFLVIGSQQLCHFCVPRQ